MMQLSGYKKNVYSFRKGIYCERTLHSTLRSWVTRHLTRIAQTMGSYGSHAGVYQLLNDTHYRVDRQSLILCTKNDFPDWRIRTLIAKFYDFPAGRIFPFHCSMRSSTRPDRWRSAQMIYKDVNASRQEKNIFYTTLRVKCYNMKHCGVLYALHCIFCSLEDDFRTNLHWTSALFESKQRISRCSKCELECPFASKISGIMAIDFKNQCCFDFNCC